MTSFKQSFKEHKKNKLLKIKFRQRLTAEEALNHDFLWTNPLPSESMKCLKTSKEHKMQRLEISEKHKLKCLETSEEHKLKCLEASHKQKSLEISKEHKQKRLETLEQHKLDNMQ